MIIQILIRRDTTANWNNFNPILANGEMGIEFLTSGTKKLKIGDGTKRWNQLEYLDVGVALEDFLNHVNNTTDAHGIDTIKNDITSINNNLNTSNSNIDNHINNINAHGLEAVRLDIDNLETNQTNLYENVTRHINNTTSAHGINNIRDDINTINAELLTTNTNLNNHIDNNDAHGLDIVKSDINELKNDLEITNDNLTTTNNNLQIHIDNNDAHGLDNVKENLSIVNSGLLNHVSNDTNAHGIDIIKSDIVEIKTDLDNTKNEVETELNKKSDIGHTHNKADITDFNHTHSINDTNNLQTELDKKIDNNKIGVANGLATLDNTGKVPLNQLGLGFFVPDYSKPTGGIEAKGGSFTAPADGFMIGHYHLNVVAFTRSVYVNGNLVISGSYIQSLTVYLQVRKGDVIMASDNYSSSNSNPEGTGGRNIRIYFFPIRSN
jgi:hypothetical protein